MSKFFTLCILAIFFAACNSTNDKKVEPSETIPIPKATNNLAGHVYYFGPAIDSTKPDILAECDCCTDDFLFLNEKDFIRIGNCMAENSVIKGTYLIGQNNVILQYDTLSYYTEADENNEIKTVSKKSKEYLIKTEKLKFFQDTITQFNFKNKLFYKNASEKSYGTISSNDSINTFVNDLKINGFWKKLNPDKN